MIKYWFITYEWTTNDGRTVTEHCLHKGSMFDWIYKFVFNNPDRFRLINNVEILDDEYNILISKDEF